MASPDDVDPCEECGEDVKDADQFDCVICGVTLCSFCANDVHDCEADPEEDEQ